jgi:hypothetical protein
MFGPCGLGCALVLLGFAMAITRSTVRNRLRKRVAIRHASQIRTHALAIEARRQLSRPEAVIMAILYFYHQRWNEGCDTQHCQDIYDHIMSLGVLDVLAASLNARVNAGAA